MKHVLFLLLVTLVACCQLQGFEFQFVKAPELDGLFQGAGHDDINGYWAGADGVYSVNIGPGKTLWIFGDTLWGWVIDGKRSNCLFVNNTVGIEEAGRLKFYKGIGKKSFFTLDTEGKWLWPLHGITLNDRLYAAFVEIERKATNIVDDPLGFSECGNYVSTVTSLQKNPVLWEKSYTRIPNSFFRKGESLIWGGYILKDKGYVYIFGIWQKGPDKNLVVARTDADRPLTDFSGWRFLSPSGWVRDAGDLSCVHRQIGSEFSVTWNEKLKKFLLVYSECIPFPSKAISLYSGSSPWGPFDVKLCSYEVDEIDPASKHFTYSGKNHPHLQGDSDIVISYIINSFTFWDLWSQSTIYFPRFLKVRISGD